MGNWGGGAWFPLFASSQDRWSEGWFLVSLPVPSPVTLGLHVATTWSSSLPVLVTGLCKEDSPGRPSLLWADSLSPECIFE